MSKRKLPNVEKSRSRRKKRRRGQTDSSDRASRRPSHRTPPVTVRKGTMATPIVNKNQRTPRRRYDVALSSPGVEIRLPAIPIIQNYWQVASGFLSVVLTVLLIISWNSPTFQVSSVQVQGLERFTSDEISRAIDVVGRPSFSLIPINIQEDLENTYAGLEKIEVNVDWPAVVVVTIEERQPVLAWNWEGSVRWVDAQGMDFKPRGEAENLIQVQAMKPPVGEGDQFASEELVKAVSAIAAYVPDDLPIIYDEEYGVGWQDPHGWQVYFGFDTENVAVKNLVYVSIVKRLQEKKIKPVLISVEYVNAPFYRLER